jgi:AcrR family transcriptional regulator
MRKTPRQSRSCETVEAIVEAATRILGRRGWARFTTNEVAKVAGVSIGSLYQYFPNKAALVSAIKRRHVADLLRACEAALKTDRPLTLEERVERLVRGVIDAHAIDPALHRVLEEEVPRDTGATGEFQIHKLSQLTMLFVTDACQHAAEPEIVAQVVEFALEGVIHRAARAKELGSPALARELTRLVCAYLKPDVCSEFHRVKPENTSNPASAGCNSENVQR